MADKQKHNYTATGASMLSVLSTMAYTGMRAQGSTDTLGRAVTFWLGFPSTLLSYFFVVDGSEVAFGVEIPKKSSLMITLQKYADNMIQLIRRFSTMQPSMTTKFVNFKPATQTSADLYLDERILETKPDKTFMRIQAIGLNRAEILQRQGKYNATKEEEKYLGLEAAGTLYQFKQGQLTQQGKGIALLSGGSYAQWVAVNPSHVMQMPVQMSFLEGACLPEAWLTAYQLIRFLKPFPKDSSVVIYAAASGVGTAAIQICKVLKLNSFAVVSSKDKADFCLSLGCQSAVIYKDNPTWSEQLLQKNKGKFTAVLDCVGSSHYPHTINLLDLDSKWILYGLLSGPKIQMNLGAILSKRIQLISTTLKTRSDEYKTDLISDFAHSILPHFQDGSIKPILYKSFKCDWEGIEAFKEGHSLMESNENIGKIVIQYCQK